MEYLLGIPVLLRLPYSPLPPDTLPAEKPLEPLELDEDEDELPLPLEDELPLLPPLLDPPPPPRPPPPPPLRFSKYSPSCEEYGWTTSSRVKWMFIGVKGAIVTFAQTPQKSLCDAV